MSSPLDWFGLPHDADDRALKRAYAQRLKTTRPEVDPVAFQQLHEQYQAALQWLQRVQAQAAHDGAFPSQEESAHAEAPAEAITADAPVETPRQSAVPRPLPSTTQFDLDVFIADYFDVAIHHDTAHVQAWLEGREELWSLHLKQQVGHALLQRFFRDPPPIGLSSVEVTLAFFGLDHALVGVDPLHMQQLRDAMQERSELVQRHRPAIQPWGANRRRLDLDAFFPWFCEQAGKDDEENLAAILQVQPALLSLAAREQAAPQILERLLQERPPMPQASASVLAQVFGLVTLATQRQLPLGELVAHLHMRWLMEPQHSNKLAMQVKSPSERAGDVTQAKRYLRMLQRPFQWWWLALAALVPKLLYSLGLFAWRLSAGAPSRLDEFFDARLTRFCIATADRTRVSWPRIFVGGVRCGVILLISAGLQYWTLQADVLSRGDTWLPLGSGVGITLCWLYYLGYTGLRLWQLRPEVPVAPRPLLRLALIPALVAAGLTLAFGFDQLVAAQFVLLTAALLSYQRYQSRNPGRKGSGLFSNVVALVYLLGIAVWVTLRFPVVSSGIAVFFWALDLTCQRKQLQLRYLPPPAPLPAQAG